MIQDLTTIWQTKPFGNSVTVGELVLVGLLIFFGYLASRFSVYLLNRRLATTRLRPDAVQAIGRIVFWLILILVFLTALSLLRIPLTAFAFITGAVAIGVGFGAQNILNNFISGWILMAEKPIRIDDFIEIDGMQGVIERIGNRSTRIRRVDGVHLLVPNSSLLEKVVVNWTLVDNSIRSRIRVGVAYGSPVREVARLIKQAVIEQEECNGKPEPAVYFEDFGDSALIFDAYFWCDVSAEGELRTVRSNIRFRISELFERDDIVIAFPQQDVHLDTSRPLSVRMVSDRESRQ